MDHAQRLNVKRILANAFARRIAYVIVAAALAWFGLGEARAQVGVCANTSDNCTRPQAYAAALEAIRIHDEYDQFPGREYRVRQSQGTATSASGTYVNDTRIPNGSWSQLTSHVFRFTSGCPAGQEWNTYFSQCKKTCASRTSPDVVTYSAMIPTGSVQCHDGCEAVVTPNGDGTYVRLTIQSSGSMCGTIPNNCANFGPNFSMNFGTGMCQPKAQECAENQTKDPVTGVCTQGCPTGMFMDATGVCKPKQEDCPAGNVRAPSGQCLPGDGQCAAGEARRANGTCGRDSDGDGEADEDDDDTANDPDKESASGGDSCTAPPSCSGGAIACMQVKIQWRIDCNTRRKVNVSGGACSAMPVCTGDNCNAMEYASLIQQWKASCNLEKLLAKDGGTGEGGQPEWTKVNGMSQDPGNGVNPEDAPKLHTKNIDTSQLDQGGLGGGGGCPGFSTGGGSGVAAGFTQSLANPPAFFCTYIGWIKAVSILVGAIISVFILMRGGR